MQHATRSSIKIGAIMALAVMAGCAQQDAAPPAPVAYNPPGTALTQLPAANVTWYHVPFENNSHQIGPEGRQAIADATASLRANPALSATVIGRTDGLGNDANNMRLSQRRATEVRNVMIRQGMVEARRIETRWTGERIAGEQPANNTMDGNNRMVDIAIH